MKILADPTPAELAIWMALSGRTQWSISREDIIRARRGGARGWPPSYLLRKIARRAQRHAQALNAIALLVEHGEREGMPELLEDMARAAARMARQMTPPSGLAEHEQPEVLDDSVPKQCDEYELPPVESYDSSDEAQQHQDQIEIIDYAEVDVRCSEYDDQ